MPNIPTLQTDRLILRAHRSEDLPDCAAMWADPLVTRHIGGRPFPREEVWWKILRYVGHWSLLDFGYWALIDRHSGRFIGEAGFADFQREMDPPLNGAPEIGWVLAPSAHGRGLATEAVRAVLAWGDANLLSKRTVCLIAPENAASLRVAEKVGYREWARSAYRGAASVLFERTTVTASDTPPRGGTRPDQ
jgi:RimJ/RimL family protein N-acetyltransferase